MAQGILAPEAGKTSNSKFSGNHRLAWAVDLRKGETTTQSWQDLAEEMKWAGREKTVISAEAFSKLSNDKVGQIKQLLNGHDVFIIVYFRNYKAYLRSVYAQVMRDHNEIRSFPKYISKLADRINYDDILRNWGGHFGYDHLIVRVYDEVIENGKLIADFCQIIGFNLPENDPHLQLQRNTTPDEKTICALRLINLFKTRFPCLLDDHTFKNLKEAFYFRKKGYK